ncbi:MAG: hypothetical protein EB127_05060 [Alphaproteobacteria bacterium]|nr:hypothetical protein [Alphaproteobacteria bacterium]
MKKIIMATCLLAATLTSSQTFANDCKICSEEDFKRFYIGGFGGYSKTAANSFKDKDTGATFHMKEPSPTFGAIVGYKITPDIMVEFSYEQKTKYPVTLTLAEKDGGDKLSSRASASTYMINFVYNLNDYNGFQPFVKLGAGTEQIRLKEATIPHEISLPHGLPSVRAPKLKTARYTSNCLALELGVGVSKKITEDFSVNLSGNLHIARNAKMKAYTINEGKTTASIAAAIGSRQQPNASHVVYDLKTIKQTFGVGEITIGFTYNLPI